MDRFEVEAIAGLDPLAALSVGLFHSDPCLAGVDADGQVVAMWGIVPVVPNSHGSIWLLSSDMVGRHVREIVKSAGKWLDEQQKRYQVLSNVVSADNLVHQRLLRHLGFTFLEPINNFGPGKVRVIPFERRM
jgi:hypothetical protein